MSEGLPRMYCRFAQREILNAPTGWPAGVTAPSQGLFPELIPLVYRLRSRGAANILRSPAMLYILLRDCRTHKRSGTTFRLMAGHGPTDEARGNALDLEAQMRLGDRLNFIFCLSLDRAPARYLGEFFSRSCGYV